MGRKVKKAGYVSIADLREELGQAATLVKSEPLLKQEMRIPRKLQSSKPPGLQLRAGPPLEMVKREVVGVRVGGSPTDNLTSF